MKVKNPTGRVDWLAASLLERLVAKQQNPVLSAVYAEVKAPVEKLLRQKIGPRNRQLRDLRKYIDRGNKMLQERAS